MRRRHRQTIELVLKTKVFTGLFLVLDNFCVCIKNEGIMRFFKQFAKFT
mgnify:CR=1 FL=1